MSLVASNEKKIEWGELSMGRTYNNVTKSSLYNVAREYQVFFKCFTKMLGKRMTSRSHQFFLYDSTE